MTCSKNSLQVVLGAAHGLIFLPVVLASFGPEAFEHWKYRVGKELEAQQVRWLEATAERAAEAGGGDQQYASGASM